MPSAFRTIHFSDLDGQKLLGGADDAPGGKDVISVHVFPGIYPDKITIILKSQVDWWKGIQANEIVLCQTQDGQNLSQADVAIDIVHEKGIQLWKASTFGIHADVYDVTDVRSWAQGGKVYTFIWQEDNRFW